MKRSVLISLLYGAHLSLLCAMDKQIEKNSIKEQYLTLKNQKHNSVEIARVVAKIYFQQFSINNWTFQKDCIHPKKIDKNKK